jgi:hypothetical protein
MNGWKLSKVGISVVTVVGLDHLVNKYRPTIKDCLLVITVSGGDLGEK